jgi:hypothetical protein
VLLYTLAFNLTFFIQELFLVVPKALTPGLRPTLFHNNHLWQGEHPLASLFQGTGALARHPDERPGARAQVLHRAARLRGRDRPAVRRQAELDRAADRQRGDARSAVHPEGHEDRVGTFFNGSFTCDDVPATYRQLRTRDVEFVSAPEKQPWGEFAVFKDPDGNQFVLSSP